MTMFLTGIRLLTAAATSLGSAMLRGNGAHSAES